MQINEVWSISFERLDAFFRSQADVCLTGDMRYSCGESECSVTVLPLRRVGSLRFPQCRVVFTGPEESTAAFYRRFYLHFLSAGG